MKRGTRGACRTRGARAHSTFKGDYYTFSPLPKQQITLADGTKVTATVRGGRRHWGFNDYHDAGHVQAKGAVRIVSRVVRIARAGYTPENDGPWQEAPEYAKPVAPREKASKDTAAWWDALVQGRAKRHGEEWWTPTELAWSLQAVDLDRLASSSYAGRPVTPGAAKLLHALNLYENAQRRAPVASAIRSAALRLTKAGLLVRVQEPEAFGLKAWVDGR